MAVCQHCNKFFARYRCGAATGECDCPKCQGYCDCKFPVYSVYWTNHGYESERCFDTVDDAVAYGKSEHFCFHVTDHHGTVYCAWDPIGGLRKFDGITEVT